MALMRSPDGSETVEVPADEISHYINRGATLVPAESPIGTTGMTESRIPYSGAPDEPGGMDPGIFMDPLNFLPTPGIGASMAGSMAGGLEADLARALSFGPGRSAIAALGERVAGSPIARLVPAIGRAAGRRVLGKGNFDDLLNEILGGGGKVVTQQVEQQAAKRATGKAAQAVEAQVGRTASRATKKTIQEGEKKIAGRIRPVRGGKPKIGTTASRVRPRGATNPVLTRRAAQINPGGAPYTGPDIGAQLQQMQEAMQYAQSRGLDPQQAYALIRQLLAGAQP